MKTILFSRTMHANQLITINVKDEERFNELIEQHKLNEGLDVTFYDIEGWDDDVVDIELGYIDWHEEDVDDFFESMEDAGFDVVCSDNEE